MRSGRLKDRVSIQAIASTVDAAGQLNETWTQTASRACAIEPINGKEYFDKGGEHTAIDVRIRLRYEKSIITEQHRLVDQRVSPNVIYDISSIINPRNENIELICMCIKHG